MATAANIMQQLATGSNRRELPPKTPLEQREEFMDDLIRGKTEASLRAQEARNKAEQIQREGLGVDTDLILKDMGSSFFRPMLKDAWGRPLTRVPNNRAYSTGMFLRQTPKHQPVSLKGFESAHGEDGIDGKPVPADHWGIRGAFRNAPGMPKLSDFVKTDQFEMDFDPQHHGDAPWSTIPKAPSQASETLACPALKVLPVCVSCLIRFPSTVSQVGRTRLVMTCIEQRSLSMAHT